MNDTVTVVGENTIIRGNLEGDEDLTVHGRVEGTVRLTRTLLVEGNGIVQADMDVKNAVVSGVVVGNITASDFVQINEEGRMVGDISAPRVIVVSGASFRGHIDMGDLTARRAEGAPVPRPAARPAPTPARAAAPPRPVAPLRPAAKAKAKGKAKAPPPAPKAKPKPKPKAKPKGKAKRKPPKPPSIARGKKKVKRKR